jgi:hypothetical protein
MRKFFINLGLSVFLILSVLICCLYFGLLLEKISQPQLKNLDTEGFVISAFPIIGLLVADFFIARRLWRSVINKFNEKEREFLERKNR